MRERRRDRHQRTTTARPNQGQTTKTKTRRVSAIGPCNPHAQTVDERDWIHHWRSEVRPRAIRLIAARTQPLAWSSALLTLVLEELSIDDLFVELVGTPRSIPVRRYAHALAVAIALRYSWQPEGLAFIARRLGISLTPAALRQASPPARKSPRLQNSTHSTQLKGRRTSAAQKGNCV
jgi:hypothetical protein